MITFSATKILSAFRFPRLTLIGLCLLSTAATPDDPDRADLRLSRIEGVEIGAPTTAPRALPPDLRQALDDARAALDDGRTADALIGLYRLRERGAAADYFEIAMLEALIDERSGNSVGGIEAARRAVTLRPASPDAHALLGGFYLRAGDMDPAIAQLRTATAAGKRQLSNPRITRAWFELGEALEQAGYFPAAVEAYSEFDFTIWESNPEHRNAAELRDLIRLYPHGAFEREVTLLARLGRVDERLAATRAALERWPDDPDIERSYVSSLLAAKHAERAFEFGKKRVVGPGASKGLLSLTIQAARDCDRLDAWMQDLSKGVESGRGGLVVQLAAELGRSGDYALAGRAAEAVLTQHPSDADAVRIAADAKVRSGALREGVQVLIDAVRRDPEHVEFPVAGVLRWVEIAETRAKLLELVDCWGAERDFAADFVLATIASAAGETRSAQSLLASCLSKRADFSEALLVQARVALAREQWSRAKEFTQRVIESHADLAAAQFVLAEALDGLDENAAAETAYKKAIRLAPDQANYALRMGMHQRRLGKLTGAQRYFQTALQRDPQNATAAEGLIDSYLRSGKPELARAQYARLDRGALPANVLRRIETMIRFVDRPFSEEHLDELRKQVEAFPDDSATARLLAGGLFLWNKLDEADRVLTTSLANDPREYHANVLKANLSFRRADFADGTEILASLAKRFPNRLEVLKPLARYYYYDFKPEQAREVWARLLRRDADSAAEYREFIIQSFETFEQYDDALKQLDQWNVTGDEQAALAMFETRLRLLLRAERKDELVKLLQSKVQESPNEPIVEELFERYGLLAEAYSEVEQRVRTRLAAQPNDAGITERLIDVLLSAGKAEDALEVARKFQASGFGDSVLRRIWMGRCEIAAGEIETGTAEFDALLSEMRGDQNSRVGVWNASVSALSQAGRTKEAAERLGRWLSEETSANRRAVLHREIVRLLELDGKHDEALKQVETWLSEAGEGAKNALAEALQWKSLVLQAAGRDDDYLKVMERRYELQPLDPGLNNDLGYTWVDLGKNIEQATRMIRRAVAERPMNSASLDSLGWAFYRGGDFERAREQLRRAVSLPSGKDPVLYDHFADAEYRVGNAKAAISLWRKAEALLTEDNSATTPANLKQSLAAKLAAAESGKKPAVAPTVAEQTGDSGK